jgi:peptidoglycan/xylan/chitin deacetylase (PgdA/CDA1 family)
MAKEILCGFGVHVDAVAGWLGSYGGEDSPDDISRGMFAGEVGSPRLLQLFKRLGIKTSWFIPGHSIETFPEQMTAVVEAGHEIGIHGYTYQGRPDAMYRIRMPFHRQMQTGESRRSSRTQRARSAVLAWLIRD